MGGTMLFLSLLPLVASQAVPFFRPDNVTQVSGRVLCGNMPVSFAAVEWWQDRGQQVDTILGSSRTGDAGAFQVQTFQPAPMTSYLIIKHRCGSQVEVSHRVEVNRLAPFNMQIQLQRPNNGPRQVSGRVLCGNMPVSFAAVEWWQDRGQQVDTILGTSRTGDAGAFQVQTSQAAPAKSYLMIKHRCGSQAEVSHRVEVDHRAPLNMQIQLQKPNNGPRMVSGRVLCGNMPVSFAAVEWWQDRGQQVDTILGSSRTGDAGAFQVQTSQPAPAKSYLMIKHRCGSQVEVSHRVEVDRQAPLNMQIQLQKPNNNGPSQLSGKAWCGDKAATNVIIEWWADRGSQADSLLSVTQTDNAGFFNLFRKTVTDSPTYLIVKHSCGGSGQQTRFPVDPAQPFNMQLQLRGNTTPQNPSKVSGTVLCGRRAASWITVEWWADRGRQVDVMLGVSQTDGRGFFSITRSLLSDRDTYLLVKHDCNSNKQRSSRFRVDPRKTENMEIQLQSRGRDRSSNSDSHDFDDDFHRAAEVGPADEEAPEFPEISANLSMPILIA